MERNAMTSSNQDLDIFNFLNETEVEKISEVIRRDKELKSTGREHLKALEDDIERIREIADLPMSSIDEVHICHLCRQMCSWFVDQAEECPTCRRKVCKFCRRDDGYDLGLLSPMQRESLKRKTNGKLWSCSLCYKLKEYKVCSGQWMKEGHSAKDNPLEINMNDSNAVNKNRQLKTEITSHRLREDSPVVMMTDGEEMMINISLRGANVVGGTTNENTPPKKFCELAKVEIPNGVYKGITKPEVREIPVISFETSRQSFQEYEEDDDELSAISEEVNDQLGRSSEGTEDDLDVVEVHERYSRSDNPSPHEVSSLTLYIRESSRGASDQLPPRNIKITSSRSLGLPMNSTPSVGSFESQSPSTPLWDQNDAPVTKSILIKKLSSTSNAPKSNSIKLLSVSSQQKETNMIPVDDLDKSDNVWEDITEDYADIRRSIISASQVPSARKNYEVWQSVNEFAPSGLPEQQRSSSWRNSENGYEKTVKGLKTTQTSRTTVEYSTTSNRELSPNPKGSFYRNFSAGIDSPKEHDLSVKERVEMFSPKSNTDDKFTDVYKRGVTKFNDIKKNPDSSKKAGKEVSLMKVDLKDEFESEEEKFDFFYGGEGKLLIPISNTSDALNGKVLRQTETKRALENMDKALDVMAKDMAGNITSQATDDIYTMKLRSEPTEFEKPSYFGGVVTRQDQSDELDSSDPTIQYYYLNGMRRSYEKKFPIEDGWYKNEQGMMVTNGNLESSDEDTLEEVDNNKSDKPSQEGHSSKDISTRSDVGNKDETDLVTKNRPLSDGSSKEFSSNETSEQLDKSSSSLAVKTAEIRDSGAQQADVPAIDSTKNSTKSTNESQALGESIGTDNSPLSASQVESGSSEVTVADVVAGNQQVEKILGDVRSDTPESSQSEKEVELNEDELRRFLAKINRQIDESILRHEKEREELLTQQQVRLDSYVKELNEYIQEHDEPALEEEEWVAEVEQIQNNELRELLEEQQHELEEMEKVRRSILNHLGPMTTLEGGGDVDRDRAGKVESTIERSAFPVEKELKNTEDIEQDVSKDSNFQAQDVEEFIQSNRLRDYVKEITDHALTKATEMKEESKEVDVDKVPSDETDTNSSQEEDISVLADHLTRDVLNTVKLESEIHVKEMPDKADENRTSEFHAETMEKSEDQKDFPIYSRIVAKQPKQSGHPSIDEKSQKINSFFDSGEEFDEVSKSTTTFGEEVSTTTTTVYKKEDDGSDEVDGALDKSKRSSSGGLDGFAVNSGSLLQDIEMDLAKVEDKNRHAVTANVVDKNVEEMKVSSSGEARRAVSTDEKWNEVEMLDGALSSSDSPQLSSEGETRGMARKMDSLYTSRMALAGEIHFGLKYEDKTGNLEIHVHQCKDIMGLGRTNPYVKTYLIPDKTRKGKRKTYTRRNTENPVFNEILKYKISRSDLESRILSLTVWHNMTFSKNEILGEVVLPMKGVDLDDKEGHWYPIHQGFVNQRWKSILDLNHDSKLEVSLLFSTKGASPQNPSHVGDLRVKVIQAKSLTSFRENGSCDAFVECFLHIPLAHDAKAKSSTRRSTRNPEWNQEFRFSNVTREQLKSSKLEITVWTQEGFQEKEFLGGVKLFSNDDIVNPEVELWEKALNSPDKSFTAVLHLRSTMDELLMD